MMAVSLPLSIFLMSVSTIFLSANWLIWGDFKAKYKRFISNPSAWIFSLIFLMHILGGLYSTDMKFYLDDLRIKLPLLVYPIVLGSTPSLSAKRSVLIMWLFTAAIVASSLFSLAIYLGLTTIPVENFRDISYFISHIRLSLLTCVAIVWIVLQLNETDNTYLKILFAAAIIWLIWFLNLLQSATAFIILSVLLLLLCFYYIRKIKSTGLRWIGIIALFLIPPVYPAFRAWDYFSSKEEINFNSLPKYTAHQHTYHHDPLPNATENGHRVFLYIARDETEKEWPKRSQVPMHSLIGNSELESIFFRYMASKNLPKDSVGIWSLSPEDIRAIESGETNYLYVNSGMPKRLYGFFQEIDEYLNGSVNGNSATQRVEYLKTGWRIFKQHPWFGVGTGDLKVAFDHQYEIEHSKLEPEFRLRAHNQYLSILIGFGCIGFTLFILGIFLPPFLNKTFQNWLFSGYLVIAMISFLSEDTLETQAGASFFIFFYGLLVWAWGKKFD